MQQTFATSEPNQQRVTIKVIEGDAPDPAACSLLGKCRITGLPKDLPKGSPIEVTYAFDASGRIAVKAKDKTGGKEADNRDRAPRRARRQTDRCSSRRLANDYQVD